MTSVVDVPSTMLTYVERHKQAKRMRTRWQWETLIRIQPTLASPSLRTLCPLRGPVACCATAHTARSARVTSKPGKYDGHWSRDLCGVQRRDDRLQSGVIFHTVKFRARPYSGLCILREPWETHGHLGHGSTRNLKSAGISASTHPPPLYGT
ncbi:uncharacterized protein LY79DRAFT_57448 [Colletotrichum navitas]|uniref:Uncharacterized protein n=1 Tax=Colletotrichum navitas TaxID=681940 RepID=A0AAD8PLK5_9PEZI|nr:uncharacterized protein LY79DRAFT_57448 [Colletotrichum navitas]KAK1569945.1 hypothetical protein LY79DRAFT_57448 [Colletotrichum navitas]